MKFKIKEKDFYKISLIGCGGTGGYLAESLSRIAFDLKEEKTIRTVFIDGDIVEEKNIGRQNFYPREIGYNKAMVLAERYSISLGIDVKYIPEYLTYPPTIQLIKELYQSDIIISAVDSADSRKTIHNILTDIHKRYKEFTEEKGNMVWIDAGNGQSSGQIIIGNSFDEKIIYHQKGKEISFLPYPSVIEPDLIDPNKEKETDIPLLSCAERISLREQSTTINQLMSSIISSMVNNLINQKGVESYKIIVNEDLPAVYPLYIKDLINSNN